MFKKDRDLTERSKTLLKNKEIRTLKQELQKQFPALSLSLSSTASTAGNDDSNNNSNNNSNKEEDRERDTDTVLQTLIPNKADVHCIKLANRTILYSVDQHVLFFDYQGRNCLYPSLYTLWRVQEMQKHLQTNLAMIRILYTYGPVSRFVLRGADFMIPGLATMDNLQGLRDQEKVCLCIVGNPLPFAIGECNVSDGSLLERDGSKRKGKAVTIMHSYGDLLVSSKIVPNDGFTPEEIFPTEKLSDEVKKVIVDATEPRAPELEVQTATETEIEETSEAVDCGAISDEENRNNESKKRDTQLMEALILAFKYVIKEKQLPMLVSVFWSTLQRCSQPTYLDDSEDDITLIEIKKTSYRKVSKFLEHCKRIDLLTYKDENGIATITGVKRMHDLFREYKVEDPEQFKEIVKQKELGHHHAVQPSTEVGYHNASSNPNGGGKIVVVDLFKMPRTMKDIFGNIHGEYGDHLKSSEIRDMLMMYIKSHGLEMAEKRSSLHIEPSDELYSLVRSAINVKSTATPPPPPEPVVKTLDNLPARTEVGEEEEEEPFPPISGSTVAGVMMFDDINSPWSRNIGMKIHKDGLKDINHDVDPTEKIKTPARIAGGSSVGGWGVDAGQQWKPISLPPPKPKDVSTKKNSSAASHSINNSSSSTSAKSKKLEKLSTSEELLSAIELSKEEFMKALLTKMTSYHAIIQPNGDVNVHSGKIPKVKVIVETRMGNKTVTLLRGLEDYDIDFAVFSKGCQKRFACSVSVSTVPGIAKEKEVVLQGNFGYDMENYLVDYCGIPRHIVEVAAGKGAKLKKK